MIRLVRIMLWLWSDRPLCTLCGEKVRDLALHRYVDHAHGT